MITNNNKVDKMNTIKKVLSFKLLFLVFSINLISNTNEYIAIADEMPTPIGGLKALYKNIEYPQQAMKQGIEGKVYAMVFVSDNGDVTKVKIVKGIGYGCDEAAKKGILQTKFNPGVQNGKKQNVKFALPINFKIN